MGFAKAGIQVQGEPILHWLLKRLRWSGPTLLVTAPGREHPAGCEAFDREATDPVAGLGPLRGILTALEDSQTPVVVVATVDMPGIQFTQLEWIAQKLLDDPGAAGVLLARGRGPSRAIEPFPSAYRKSAAPIIAGQLTNGRRAVHGLLKLDTFRTLDAPHDWPQQTWTNLNTPTDRDAFLASPEAQED